MKIAKIEEPKYKRCLLIFLFILMLNGCGGGSVDGDKSDGTASIETGNVTFNVAWQSRRMMNAFDRRSPSDDVCTDYNVDTIACNVYDASGKPVRSQSWRCSLRSGTIARVPTGSGMWLMLEGLTSGTPLWRGQSGTFTISANEPTDAGRVSLDYIGDDTERPRVDITAPASGDNHVSLTSGISVTFSEDVVSASVTGAFTVTADDASVSGVLTYDAASWTATFTPEISLSESTTYTATIRSGVEDLAGNPLTDDYIWSFTSASFDAPAITTQPATAVTRTSARLNALVNPNGLGTTYYFEYGPDLNYGSVTSHQDAGSGSEPVPVFADIEGLDQNSVYHFKVVADSAGGTSNGTDSIFKTDAVWTRTYDFSDGSMARCKMMKPTSDGGQIILGQTDVNCGFGDLDVWVMKLSADGLVDFELTYDLDVPVAIEQTVNGGYIMTGYTRDRGAGGDDIWVIKFGGGGWQQTYGGTGHDRPSAIQQTSDGGFIISGITESFGAGGSDIWIIKLSSHGIVDWQMSYGGTSWDDSSAIRQTSDGGYIVAGDTGSFGAEGSDLWLLKLNANGSLAWQKRFGGPGNESGTSVLPTTDGGYIAVASTASFGAGHGDVWILKLDGSGTAVWQKTYGGNYDDYVSSIHQTDDGGYIAVGYTEGFGDVHGFDTWVLKLHADGTVAWQRIYEGSVDDYGINGHPTQDGGYVVAANTTSFGAHYSDLWLLKLGQNGSDVCGLGKDSTATVFSPDSPGATTSASAAATSVDASWFANLSEEAMAVVGTECP